MKFSTEMPAIPQFDLCEKVQTSEYEQRIAKVRAEMEHRGLDMLVLFDQSSMYYLFHYDQAGYWIYQTILLPLKGEPVALVRHADVFLARQSPVLRDVRAWGDDTADDPAQMTVDLLRDAGCVTLRVGIESNTSALTGWWYSRLTAAMSRAGGKFEEASDLVGHVRMRKSPAEIGFMRRAGKLYDIAIRAARAASREGVSELDVAGDVMNAVCKSGGDWSAGPVIMSSGINTLSFTHYHSSRKVLRRGEPVVMEYGACVNRYHAVGCEIFAIGEANAELEALYKSMRRTIEAGRRLLAPGVPVAEVARAMAATFDAQARADWEGMHHGYGTGIGYGGNWLENLKFQSKDRQVLEEGFTFFLMTGRFTADKRNFLLAGEPLLIIPGGHEALSQLERDELWIAP